MSWAPLWRPTSPPPNQTRRMWNYNIVGKTSNYWWRPAKHSETLDQMQEQNKNFTSQSQVLAKQKLSSNLLQNAGQFIIKWCVEIWMWMGLTCTFQQPNKASPGTWLTGAKQWIEEMTLLKIGHSSHQLYSRLINHYVLYCVLSDIITHDNSCVIEMALCVSLTLSSLHKTETWNHCASHDYKIPHKSRRLKLCREVQWISWLFGIGHVKFSPSSDCNTTDPAYCIFKPLVEKGNVL